jgi:thiamine biosynthesis lipoprotein
MASTTQFIGVDATPGAIDDVEGRLRQLESRWSRFIETSDITRLNQQTGRWVYVSDDTIRLIEAMQLANRATGGRFDPTHLHRLLSIGYTSSIDDPDRYTIAIDEPHRGVTIQGAEIDRANGAVRFPLGLSIDPGGIGKGLAADIVATELLADGTAGALVSIGGDIAATGTPPSDVGWIIDVEDPHRSHDTLTTLVVSGGGIATSSTRSRRWTVDGNDHHHIIDPATGDESRTDLATVTVVANAGWLAEAHATAALVHGSAGAIDYLDAHGLAGIAVTDRGDVSATRALALATPQGTAP